MRCSYSCGSADHVISRRSFLGTAGLGLGLASGFSGLIRPAAAAELERRERQVLLFWLAGGASQLETWDPKPKTETGGPFRSIETSVPGVRISELLPRTARQMHRLALVRGVNTKEDDHGKGYFLMHTGRREAPGQEYPHLGSLAAKYLTSEQNPLPGYIHIQPSGGGFAGGRGGIPRAEVRLARSGQRARAGQHGTAGVAQRRRRLGSRTAAPPAQRPVRPPPPDGRDRRLHNDL